MMLLRLNLLLGLIFLAASCSSPVAPRQSAPMPPKASAWNQEVHRQLNEYRASKGLRPLAYHQGLEQLCHDHSAWLRAKRGSSYRHGSNVSHSGSRYRAKVSRVEYGMEAWAENVAYISETPDDVARKLILMWRSSPSHHKAMIGNWTHAGNAISVDSDGAIFATMNFGRHTN